MCAVHRRSLLLAQDQCAICFRVAPWPIRHLEERYGCERACSDCDVRIDMDVLRVRASGRGAGQAWPEAAPRIPPREKECQPLRLPRRAQEAEEVERVLSQHPDRGSGVRETTKGALTNN